MIEFDDHIKELVREHGSPCISIIVPTHPNGIKVEQDKKGVLQAIILAIRSTDKISDFKQTEILSSLNAIYRKVDFDSNSKGIGIFVSPKIQRLIKLPLPVTRKILVNEVFDLHELLYAQNYSEPYYLLDISKQEYHLFRGSLDHLDEISDENFPIKLVDDFEYTKPNQSSSNAGYAHTKGFEKDKSILQKMRAKQNIRKAIKLLTRYLVSKDTPLIVCGLSENVSMCRLVAHTLGNVIFSIGDNYRHVSLHDLAIFAWTTMRAFLDQKKMNAYSELREKIGTPLAECGVANVWKAAKDGRGYKLLVERDFNMSAFVSFNEQIFLERPSQIGGRMRDIVNEIITTVLERNGEVIVVENDVLKDFNRIAMINRY